MTGDEEEPVTGLGKSARTLRGTVEQMRLYPDDHVRPHDFNLLVGAVELLAKQVEMLAEGKNE